MKRIFTLFVAFMAIVTVYAADYQLSLAYARAYVMDADTHQFQFEFVDMQTYEGQGSIFFCANDNNHINGQYTIDGKNCTALLVVGEDQTFEAVSGSFSIAYTREANYMHNYAIEGILTDKNGKTLEITGEFGSYSAYDYSSYEKYLMGETDYTELVSYDLNDYLDAVVNYDITAVDSVGGYNMYRFYEAQYGEGVASWRINLHNERKLVAQVVIYTQDNTSLAGAYDVKRNAFTYISSEGNADATSGLFTIAFDHKTDSIAYYTLKGSLQHSQGEINLDCVLPIGDGAIADYQSMAENYADPTVAIQYVVPQDYAAFTGVSSITQQAEGAKTYDFSGRRIDANQPKRGLYIVRGKKMIAK